MTAKETTSVTSSLLSSCSSLKELDACQTIYSVPSMTEEINLPDNIFNDTNKAFRASSENKVEYLDSADKLFIRLASTPCLGILGSQYQQYEVLDHIGEQIAWGIDTSDAYNDLLDGLRPFNVMVFDTELREGLLIEGQPGVRKVTVKHNGNLLGQIYEDDYICAVTPTYSLTGASGWRGLRVVGPENSIVDGFPPDSCFDVYLSREIISPAIVTSPLIPKNFPPDSDSEETQETNNKLIARIRRQNLVFGKGEEGFSPTPSFVVTYHPDMDLQTKCLLLSLAFVINHRYFHEPGKRGVSMRSWFMFIFSFSAMVIIILIGLNLLKEVYASYNTKNSTTEPPFFIGDFDK